MLKLQEDAGLDIVTDGEVFRQHFVHGILEHVDGLDFRNKKRIGIRNDRYEADCPRVVAPIARRRSIHAAEAAYTRAHTARTLKFTMPGPMTIVDTLADEHYRDRPALAMEFAKILNQEALELEAAGVDVIQFDEPAYNVYLDEVATWGIETLERAAEGLRARPPCTSATATASRPTSTGRARSATSGGSMRRPFPCSPGAGSTGLAGVRGVARAALRAVDAEGQGRDGGRDRRGDGQDRDDRGRVAQTIRDAMKHVAPERIIPSTNCGMVPLSRDVAVGKVEALAKGAAIVRQELGKA